MPPSGELDIGRVLTDDLLRMAFRNGHRVLAVFGSDRKFSGYRLVPSLSPAKSDP